MSDDIGGQLVSYFCEEAGRGLLDEGYGIGGCGSLLNLLICGTFASVGDVLADGALQGSHHHEFC